MTQFDVFNGDADGICSLHQLRLSNPRESVLITGVKRDISLVKHVRAEAGDSVTILDISMEKNHADLLKVLSDGAQCEYFDHHFPGDIPKHAALQTHIDTAAETCTGLIVNKHLDGQHLPWAVTAAFGDNLDVAAKDAAAPLKLTNTEIAQLKTLGILLNYNGYGASIEDLFFPPANLYLRVKPYTSPFDFIEKDDAYKTLDEGYRHDRERVEAINAETTNDVFALYILPNDPFARRISGVYANELARANPDRAHALLSELEGGVYQVSLRAPLNNREGADDVCRQFETGGGRKAAAGVNRLPENEIERFRSVMMERYS